MQSFLIMVHLNQNLSRDINSSDVMYKIKQVIRTSDSLITMKEPRLPMDVLIEVLILLPLKSLLKFRCVSKTWRDLISSPLFIDRHLKCDRKHSVLLVKLIPNHVLTPQSGKLSQMLSFHYPDFPELSVSPDLRIPIPKDLNIPSYNNLLNIPIHGPCNGLVCIAVEEFVFLCNPALREFKLLPPLKFPENHTAHPLGYGFGFDQIGGVYKVIQISDEHDLHYNRVDLYDSASNSWKQIEAKVPYIIDSLSVGLLFKGAIHWYAITDDLDDHPFVLCFDMSSEDFQHLDFHDNFSPPKWSPDLMELDGSLAMACIDFSIFPEVTSDIEIWVMKKYGKKESWTKHFVLRTFSLIRPLLFLKNEWLVFETFKGQLAACTIHGNGFKKFEIYGSRRSMSAVIYEERA
ncbi:F-box/kelch-repeat protein At3g23880-like [Primulina eburnea]|uniref:F-box/kelch-repeat protein At3g23880-like n=1 Tax=Primulina eburnea TaxID=1245227 RepID=UPI003C6BE22D